MTVSRIESDVFPIALFITFKFPPLYQINYSNKSFKEFEIIYAVKKSQCFFWKKKKKVVCPTRFDMPDFKQGLPNYEISLCDLQLSLVSFLIKLSVSRSSKMRKNPKVQCIKVQIRNKILGVENSFSII